MDIKQLRCKQCGGSISQHEKYGTYRCDYCHASFFLDESENNAFKPQGISERIPQKTDRYKKIPLKQVHYLPLLCEKDYPGRFLTWGIHQQRIL